MGPVEATSTDQEQQEPQLPVRKWNSPVARIVCWHCHRNDRTLYRVRDDRGRKTQDYVCSVCRLFVGRPPIGNVSMIRFEYREGEAA